MPAELPAGTVTILFTDVVGSTALSTGHGDEPAHAILQVQRALIRRFIHEHDGAEVKTAGDGFMIAFASARQGVACAIAIQRALAGIGTQPLVRMGLNTGDPIREGDDLFGTPVIAADRIMNKAAGGQILVSETVLGVLGAGTDCQFADRGRHRLKGFPQRWRLYEVLWRDEPVAAAPSNSQLPFVGRDAELLQLRGVLRRAKEGQGSIVLLGGEAGAGKTRLAEEMTSMAREEGFITLSGRCYEDAGGLPYAPFLEIFEQAKSVPLAASAGSRLQFLTSRGLDEEGPQSFLASFDEFVAGVCGERPLHLLIDDIHWADSGSIQLLRLLSRRITSQRLTIVGTYREDEVDLSAPLGQALEELQRKRVGVDVQVSPFDVASVGAVLQAASGQPPPSAVTTLLHRETGGNVFFVEELYRHLAEEGHLFDEAGKWRSDISISSADVPRTLRLVIGRRLARLDEGTIATLNAAAVLGTSFDVSVLERMSSMADDDILACLDEAEHAQLIRPEAEEVDGRLRFAHPLIRSAIVSALSSGQRQRLHASAAAAIEQIANRSSAQDAELAHHYQRAGRLADPVLAFSALKHVAEAALVIYANVEARSYLEDATKQAARIPQLSLAERGDIALMMGKADFRLGEWRRSGDWLDRAQSLFEEAGDPGRKAQALHAKASLATFEARPGDALHFLEEARELASAAGDELLVGLSLQLEAQNLVDVRQYDRAHESVTESIRIGEHLRDPYLQSHARLASGYLALASLDLRRAEDDFGQISAMPLATSHERMAAESRRALSLACLGELDEAVQRGAIAREYFLSMHEVSDSQPGYATEHDPYEFGFSCLAEAMSGIARGRLRETVTMLLAAVDHSGDPPNVRVLRTLGPALVRCLYLEGDFDEAQAWVEKVAPATPARTPAFARAFAALADTVRDPSASVDGIPTRGEDRLDLLSLPVTLLTADAAVVREDCAAAERLVSPLEYLHSRGVVFSLGWVALVPRVLGSLHRLVANHQRALELLTSALDIAERRSATLELGLTHLELARLQQARSDPHSARLHAAEAERLLRAVGARTALGQLEVLAASLPPSGPGAKAR